MPIVAATGITIAAAGRTAIIAAAMATRSAASGIAPLTRFRPGSAIDDAEQRRQQDEHRGRGPRNYTRSGDRIREDVSDRLTDDWGVDASDIEVNVSGTEVTLTGTVLEPRSAPARRRCRRNRFGRDACAEQSARQGSEPAPDRIVERRRHSASSGTSETSGSGGMGTLGSASGTSSAGAVGGTSTRR